MRLVVSVTLLTIAIGVAWVLADPPSTGTVLRAALFVILAASATALGLALARAYPPARPTPLEVAPTSPSEASLPADLRRALLELRAADASADSDALRTLLASWEQA